MSSNESGQVMGMKPSDDPKADQLVNSNIAQPLESQEEYGQLGEQPLNEKPIDEEYDESGGINMDTPVSEL